MGKHTVVYYYVVDGNKRELHSQPFVNETTANPTEVLEKMNKDTQEKEQITIGVIVVKNSKDYRNKPHDDTTKTCMKGLSNICLPDKEHGGIYENNNPAWRLFVKKVYVVLDIIKTKNRNNKDNILREIDIKPDFSTSVDSIFSHAMVIGLLAVREVETSKKITHVDCFLYIS